jgi:hypothetical protein
VDREPQVYRGNSDDVAGRPEPSADSNLVRHVLYLGGPGRSSPYLSLTADRATAVDFGTLWESSVAALNSAGARHLPTEALITALKRNQGRSKWPSARDRQRALKYVEQHGEELADYRSFSDARSALAAVNVAFVRSR